MAENLKVIALVLLCTLFGVVMTLNWCGNIPVSLTDLMQFLGAVASAFFGAWAAFHLQESREARKEQTLNSQGIRELQFSLVRQLQRLENLNKQVLEPSKSDSDRWYTMPAYIQVEYNDLKINYGSLGFLLKKNPTLLMKIQVAEESFVSAVQMLNIRSSIHTNQLQPAVGKVLSNIIGIPPTVDGIAQHLESHIVHSMQTTTDECFSIFEHALTKNKESLAELLAEAESLFPQEQFLVLGELG